MLSALSSANLLSVLFMIEHTHVLVKILRVGEKEVCHVEMALCKKWIIMLAFYAQHVKKKREAELTFGIAGSTVDGNGDICNVCLLCGHRISPSICLVISRNKKKGYIIADIAKKVFPRVSIEFPKLYAYTQISNRKKL